MIEAAPFDLVLTDFRMAEMNGLELLTEIKKRRPECLVILMTAYATVENAVAAMKAGAFDYVTKPFSLEQIQHLAERALQLQGLRAENRALRNAIDEAPLLESSSAAMVRLMETARQAAASEATVLLSGESGTGKNVLARQIHRWSPRHERPFVVVNCTTLSEELLESELFGHVRGAFTGAIKDKPGRLEAADGGTVFLDEIADLSGALQTKFLRFVQEQSFERVGGDRTIHVDIRIIAASNRDLRSEVAARRFREDLFYRLNVITLSVPPLRERREDILPLAQWLLTAASVRNRRAPMQLAPEAAAALKNYNWPGNVRELRNALERAAVLCRSDVITLEDLPDSIFREVPDSGPRAAGAGGKPREGRARAHHARARPERDAGRSRGHARHQRDHAMAQAQTLRDRLSAPRRRAALALRLAKRRNDHLRHVAEHLALVVRGRQHGDFLDSGLLQRAYAMDDLFGRAHDADSRDRLGRDEAPLLGHQERAVAFMDLAEARGLGQAVVLHALQVVVPDVGEKRRDQFILLAALFPDFVGEMYRARHLRAGLIDDSFVAELFAGPQHARGGQATGVKVRADFAPGLFRAGLDQSASSGGNPRDCRSP